MRILEVSFYSKRILKIALLWYDYDYLNLLGSYSYCSDGCKYAEWSWGQSLQQVDIFYNNIVKITTFQVVNQS